MLGPPAVFRIFSPSLGSADFLPKFQHSEQFQFADTLSWTRGVHAFRFGADVMLPMKLNYLDVPTRGRLTYDGSYTQFAWRGLHGNALADCLVGTVRKAALSNLDTSINDVTVRLLRAGRLEDKPAN